MHNTNAGKKEIFIGFICMAQQWGKCYKITLILVFVGNMLCEMLPGQWQLMPEFLQFVYVQQQFFGTGRNVVVARPDSRDRYLSFAITKL